MAFYYDENIYIAHSPSLVCRALQQYGIILALRDFCCIGFVNRVSYRIITVYHMSLDLFPLALFIFLSLPLLFRSYSILYVDRSLSFLLPITKHYQMFHIPIFEF